MNRLRILDDAVAALEVQFLWLSHALIAVLVVVAVVFRYFVGDPLIWTEEVIVTLFAWMLFIGLASGFRERMHLRIDALLILLPLRARYSMGAAAMAATVATLLALAWFGIDQAISLVDTQTPMMRISASWGVAALPLGALLSCLHIVRHAVDHGLDQTLWPRDLIAAAVEVDE